MINLASVEKTRRARLGNDVFAHLMLQDERLVRAGFPPISPWWATTLGDFYKSGKRKLVLRVGRRGGKSSTLSRLGVAETLYGDHSIPPGDIGWWPVVSTTKEEAIARLVTIRAILAVLNVDHRPASNGIAGVIIEGRNVGFRVFPATISGVSGFTGIGIMADEVAKWKDKETGANPATEVLRSIGPTIATQPHAREILSSSPFSTIDAHAEAYERGNTEEQMVAWAPTWVANPTITEAETRALEPDEQTWLREYKAIPMGSRTSHWFDHSSINAAISNYTMPLRPEPGTVVTAGGDLAFISDSAALAIGHTVGEWEHARFTVADLDEVQPQPGMPSRPGDVIGRFAQRLKLHGLEAMMADAHYKMTVVEHFEKDGLGFLDAPTTVADPFVRLRVFFNGGRATIPKHDRLIRQLKDVMFRPTPNGAISIIQPRGRGGHGDIVSALVLAAWQRGGIMATDLGPPKPLTRGPELDAWMAEREERETMKRELDEIASRESAADRAWKEQSGEWWDR